MKGRVCLITKFPPLQGGVAARAYWVARSLAARGWEVTVVSDGVNVDRRESVRRPLRELLEHLPGGVRARFLEPSAQPYRFHPTTDSRVSRLASLAIGEAGTTSFDVVVATYLEPYGAAAALVSMLTESPMILMHAGSDLSRLLGTRDLQFLLQELLLRYPVVTGSAGAAHLRSVGAQPEHLHILPRPLPPWLDLPSSPCPSECLVAIVGKLSPPRLDPALHRAITGIGGKIVLCGEPPYEEFDDHVRSFSALPGVERKSFVWPWEVPDLIQAATAISTLRGSADPLPLHMGGVPVEATAAGRLAACPKKDADALGLPSGLPSTPEELAKILKAPSRMAELVAEARLAVLAQATKAEGVVRFEAFVNGLEAILEHPLAPANEESTASVSSAFRSLQAARSPSVLFRDSIRRGARRASPNYPSDADYSENSFVVRRLPIAIANHETPGRKMVLATTPGFGVNEWNMSDLAVGMLARADACSTAAELASLASNYEQGIFLLQELIRRRLVSLVADPRDVPDDVPPLELSD